MASQHLFLTTNVPHISPEVPMESPLGSLPERERLFEASGNGTECETPHPLARGIGVPPLSDLEPYLAVPTSSDNEPPVSEPRAVRKRARPAGADGGATPKVARAPGGRQRLWAAMERHVASPPGFAP